MNKSSPRYRCAEGIATKTKKMLPKKQPVSHLRLDNVKIDIALARKGWNNQDLADAIGVSPVRLSNIRYKSLNPRPATVGGIAAALNTDVVEILKGIR